MPAIERNRSKLGNTSSQNLPTALAFIGGKAGSVVLRLFMTLLSYMELACLQLQGEQAVPSFFNRQFRVRAK
jgi:hypothetical protein